MRIAILQERAAGETRVAVTSETVRKFIALGATVAVERGADVDQPRNLAKTVTVE